MRDPGLNRRTTYRSDVAPAELLPPGPTDALSSPSVEDLLPGGLAFWPRGAAWGTPDGLAASPDSVIAKLTRVLLAPFVSLYIRLFALTFEARATTLVESLSDWERDFGLPDDCSAFGDTLAERKAALLSKVRSSATITPQDFVQLAYQAGYTIEIEEPAMFECGFSQCGGEHTVGNARQHAFWIVHVYGLALRYFRVGESQVSVDRLFEVPEADGLECLFADISPAWSMPVFVYH